MSTETIPQVLITPSSITVSFNGTNKTYLKSQHAYNLIKKIVFSGDWKTLEKEMSLEEKAKTLGTTIRNETLIDSKGNKAHKTLEEKLTDNSCDALAAFKKDCEKNPEERAVNELFDFLRHKGLPLTTAGSFIAWKGVREDFYDIYTGKTNNKPGSEPFMDRKDCDLDRNNSCSKGFHVGTYDFANDFAENHDKNCRLLLVEVFPRHVTSIPKDSNCKKLRCHKYKVHVEFKRNEIEETPETFIKNFAENLYKSSIKTKIYNPLTKEMEKKKREQKKEQKKEVSGKYKPTKKEILNYVLHLHSTKKGTGYTKKMVENKWEKGLEILKDIATNPKNPTRINKTTAAILLRVLNA